jgi:hypothetical protein
MTFPIIANAPLANRAGAGYTAVVTPLASLLLALAVAVPSWGGEGRRIETPGVVPTLGALPAAPGLTSSLPATTTLGSIPQVPSLAVALAPGAQAQAAAAPGARAELAAAPAALAPAAPGLPGAAAQAAGPVSPEAAADADLLNGRILFDQAASQSADGSARIDDIVSRAASRPLRAGVFIQQEQEGSLIAPDSRDSSGNIFRYYRPVEMRGDLAEQVQQGLSGLQKVGTSLRRAFRVTDRKSAYAAWDAWPLQGKLAYLDKLEKVVVAEKGPQAAWDEKVSLLLERAPGAPDFLTKNPHMESPPAAYRDAVGARFLQPELVSDKAHPASTIAEALGRTRQVIAETGHAGTQYHVFVKAEPAALQAQLPRLQAALQLINNALFVKAAQESMQNVVHPSLLPWHRGRSQRVAALLEAAEASPHVPQAEDADSEKHAFVGLRYWGTENGKLVISFELRGASLPWKAKKSMARDGFGGNPELPKRDYAEAQRWLSLLALYAEQLTQGRAPALAQNPVVLDAAAAEAVVRARARELGMPDDAYYGPAEFGRRLSGGAQVAPGYLFPFAAAAPGSPALRALVDAMLAQSARLRSVERGGQLEDNRRNIEYMFWSAYREWAGDYEARERGRLEALFRAVGAQ